jgi:hypothetical protein
VRGCILRQNDVGVDHIAYLFLQLLVLFDSVWIPFYFFYFFFREPWSWLGAASLFSSMPRKLSGFGTEMEGGIRGAHTTKAFFFFFLRFSLISFGQVKERR